MKHINNYCIEETSKEKEKIIKMSVGNVSNQNDTLIGLITYKGKWYLLNKKLEVLGNTSLFEEHVQNAKRLDSILDLKICLEGVYFLTK